MLEGPFRETWSRLFRQGHVLNAGFRINTRRRSSPLKHAPAILVGCHQEAVEPESPGEMLGPLGSAVSAWHGLSLLVTSHPLVLGRLVQGRAACLLARVTRLPLQVPVPRPTGEHTPAGGRSVKDGAQDPSHGHIGLFPCSWAPVRAAPVFPSSGPRGSRRDPPSGLQNCCFGHLGDLSPHSLLLPGT